VKSIRPVLQGLDRITASQIVATLAAKYKEGVSKTEPSAVVLDSV